MLPFRKKSFGSKREFHRYKTFLALKKGIFTYLEFSFTFPHAQCMAGKARNVQILRLSTRKSSLRLAYNAKHYHKNF